MDTATTDYLLELTAAAYEPGLTGPVRVNRLRTVAEVYSDIRDAMAVTSFVLPGAAIDAVTDRHTELRRDLADVTGVLPWSQGVIASAADTGTDPALQIVRTLARPLTIDVVPGLLASDLAGSVDASDYSMETQILIGDIADGKPNLAGAVFSVSHGFVEWLDPAGRVLIDQIVDDVVTRGAELSMGATIATGATPATSVTGTLGEQLDAAEGQASAGSGSVADLLLVNPVDWPAVRRIVASTWTDAMPHPRPVESVGIPAGTVIVAASVALVLEAAPVSYTQTVVPRTMGKSLMAARNFRAIVRHAAGVVAVSL